MKAKFPFGSIWLSEPSPSTLVFFLSLWAFWILNPHSLPSFQLPRLPGITAAKPSQPLCPPLCLSLWEDQCDWMTSWATSELGRVHPPTGHFPCGCSTLPYRKRVSCVELAWEHRSENCTFRNPTVKDSRVWARGLSWGFGRGKSNVSGVGGNQHKVSLAPQPHRLPTPHPHVPLTLTTRHNY